MTSSRIGQIGVPAAVVGIVLMMVVPMPAPLLDLLLVCNMSAAVLVLLISLYVDKPLDFSSFPSMLLIATMFRLALNVSSTRLVLLDGYAGKVVEAFGSFVVGGSVVVGLVVFLILVVIQFIVITNGAGRVAEVGARFTLDAMPGKQMAIDADLNAGLITEAQARARRREISEEADFYGAMDGASKFVKGDAIAGIVITVINLVGGFVVGTMQRGLPLGEAASTYSLLTVGDGLVSQIPALLISIASGLIITRTSGGDVGSTLLHQFGQHAHALKVGAGCLGVLALVPGLPKVPFLVVAAALWFAAGRTEARTQAVEAAAAAEEEEAAAGPATTDPTEELLEEMRVDPLELEIAYGLMDLVDPARGGDLLDRVKSLRRKIALELGIVIPPVRTRDNIDLQPHEYVIRVHRAEVARGEAPPGHVLVLGDRPPEVPGHDTVDPVFGMAASWVPAEYGPQAELSGLTVVDRASVLTAHLAEVVRSHAGQLLSRQDVKALFETVRRSDPVVTEEAQTAGLTLAEVQSVLERLLDEQVPIRDLVRILEVMTERARVTRETAPLVEAVRQALGPAITSGLAPTGELPAITLDPLVEQALAEAVRPGEDGPVLDVDPAILERLVESVTRTVHAAEEQGRTPALVVSARVRGPLRRVLRGIHRDLPVVAYPELARNLRLDTMGVIDLAQPAAV
ncbi:MAG TPA: flagellar biosynthesis protein FlhA [Acidimicrobiales bacterium]|nr:flagellar biosynthesis protein FlhA [Acidimicrobiales bacterium]